MNGDGKPMASAAAPVWTDTHVHFDAFAAEGVLAQVLERARRAGVRRFIAIGGNDAANELALQSSRDLPAVRAVIGYDRDQAGRALDIERLAGQCAAPRVAGVGETGLDYFYLPGKKAEQRALFSAMLALARTIRKPAVIHCRDAEADMLAILREHRAAWQPDWGAPGILHCFTGTPGFAEDLLGMGFLLSFSGILTFRNAEPLRQVACAVPMEQLLVETDSPYLAPVPVRGQRNEPAFLIHTAHLLAKLKNCPVTDLSAITERNASRVFGAEIWPAKDA